MNQPERSGVALHRRRKIATSIRDPRRRLRSMRSRLTRESDRPAAHLEQFLGAFHVDCCGGFDRLQARDNVILTDSWADHAELNIVRRCR